MVFTAVHNIIFIVASIGISLYLWGVAKRTASWSADNTAEREILDAGVARQRTEQWSDDSSNNQSVHRTSQSQHGMSDETQSQASTSDNQDYSGSQLDFSSLDYPWTIDTGVSFSDVGGMEEVKQKLKVNILKPIRNSKRANKLGVSASNVVFYGPPGTGKTYLAKSLASETGLPFVQLSGADIQSKWINESSQQVKQLFDEANKVATSHGGALIFVDELDSVLKTRNTSGNAHAEDDKVVNEFLNHLEDAKENGIIFIGATNRIDSLDTAATRSGRIDEKVKIGKPDDQTRKKILATHLDDRQHDVSDSDISRLSEKTEGLVAAEIEQAVNAAAKQVLARDGREITYKDLKQCLNKI